jgi:glycosyltransferase involved in cell wall biosynthesis
MDANVTAAACAAAPQGSVATTPTVTVVVPVFNKASYLGACLDSILRQTLRNIEVICVDDASSDGSADVLARYAEADPRVKVISNAANRGPGPSRNLGIAVAASPFLQFTDADDILPDDALEKLHGRALEDQVDIVRGTISRFQSANQEQQEVLDAVSEKSAFVPLDEQSLWIPWWHTSYLIARSLLMEHNIGYPHLRSGEDPVFLASVLVKARRMSTVADVTYLYRIAPMEEKGRAKYGNLKDYVQHARMVKEIFSAHRPDCWTKGYGPHVQQDIEKQVQRYPLSDLEHRRLLGEAEEMFAVVPAAEKRVLFVYRHCGLGGVETSILNKLEALRSKQVAAQALFLKYWGEGGKSIAQRPDVHVGLDRESQLALLRQPWDALVIVDTPEFFELATESNIRCPVFLETHASYRPALDHYYSKVQDPLVSAVIAPSQFNKERLVEAGCPEDKIHVIPNAIDPGVFSAQLAHDASCAAQLPENVPLVLNIGRLEPQKNTLEFVRIALALLAQGQHAHFVVVGDAVNTADYAAEVHAAIPGENRDSFTFIPRIDYEDMPQLYLRAASSGGCLVVTSLNESQPMILLEAIASGCSVVAARIGGIGEVVIDSVTGSLYESGDTGVATDAVRRVLKDALTRERMARQGLSFLKLEHSPTRTAELYAALVGSARRPAPPALMSQTEAGRFAARLDALVGEFVSLHMTMLQSQGRTVPHETALGVLFSEPMLAASEVAVKAYSDIVPGVQIGFEPTGSVLITLQPKQDFSRSPDSCLNMLSMSFSGTSRWLTLELALGWEQLRDSTRYQFGLYAQPDRPVTGKAVLRLPRKAGGTFDHRFAELRLSETGRSCHRSGALRLPDLSETDPERRPRLLFFFDSKANLTLRVDYLTLYFS